MTHRPPPAPPWWLIFAMIGVAFALVLSGCSPRPLGNDQLPDEAVLIYRCPPWGVDRGSREIRADIYALPDRSKVWLIYPGYSTMDPIDPALPLPEACPK